MIDPDDPPEVQIAKQQRIIDALIRRAEHGTQVGSSAYALFNSAIALQGQVWAKTRDLEQALSTLGTASDRLESSEEARRRIQRNLADAVEAMESGFALFTDGRLQICNQLFRRFLPDLSQQVEAGMTLADYFKALMASRFVLPADEAAAALPGEMFRPEAGASFMLPVRGDRWFQITRRKTDSGNMVVLLTEVTRIIRRGQMERAELIDSQAQFLQTAFDHMNFGVATFSSEGVLMQCNTRFRALLDLPIWLCEKGTVLPQLLHYLESGHVLSGMTGALDYDRWRAEVTATEDARWQMRHSGGAVLDAHMHMLPGGARLVTLRDTSAENAAKALLEDLVARRTHDLTEANAKLRAQMTELEQTRQDLLEARDRAEAAVSSKTRFLAAASHDLLQPVNAAKLFLSSLQDQAGDGPLVPILDRLDRSFSSIDSLLHALLDISRLDSTGVDFSIKDFPIRQLMAQVEADTAPLAEKKGIDLRIMPCGAWVSSDQFYLARSVQNIVLNAIQYTPAGGRVLLGCRRRGNTLRIEVWDTGIGISPADQSRIFDAFTRVQAQPSADGMGLGLSIVEQACRHLGHRVGLDSQPGHGSVFRIEVPRVKARDEPVTLALPDDEPPADMDLIVAVVENDPDVLLATSQRLESWGASVLAASSTEEAAELVRSIGIAPDLLIVDYQLQDEDNGVTAIRHLRQITGAEIPAVMITATRAEALHELAAQYDFTILHKPVQPRRLRPLIDWKTRAGPHGTKPTGQDAP